jgi:hypothetical protein
MPSTDGKLLRIEFMQIPNGGWFQGRKEKEQKNYGKSSLQDLAGVYNL